MRTAALLTIGVMLCATGGCSLWRKPSVPPPKTEQIVLHGIVDFNKSAIRPDSKPLLEEAAATLKERGNLAVVVEGHSDSRGSTKYNQKLSLRRAVAVRDYLIQLGVASGRIIVLGKGASEPVDTNATREGRARNRRVVLTVYRPEHD